MPPVTGRKWRSHALAGALAALMLGCANPPPAADAGDAAGQAGGVRSEAIDSVHLTWHSGFDQPEARLIRDQESWLLTWSRIMRGVAPAPEAPSIDFSREMLLLVALGSQPNPGYQVRIDSVKAAGGTVEAYTTRIEPGSNCVSPAVIGEPVHVVRLRRLSGALVIQETRKTQPC